MIWDYWKNLKSVQITVPRVYITICIRIVIFSVLTIYGNYAASAIKYIGLHALILSFPITTWVTLFLVALHVWWYLLIKLNNNTFTFLLAYNYYSVCLLAKRILSLCFATCRFNPFCAGTDFRRQNLTSILLRSSHWNSKVFIMNVDPWQWYWNVVERANYDI